MFTSTCKTNFIRPTKVALNYRDFAIPIYSSLRNTCICCRFITQKCTFAKKMEVEDLQSKINSQWHINYLDVLITTSFVLICCLVWVTWNLRASEQIFHQTRYFLLEGILLLNEDLVYIYVSDYTKRLLADSHDSIFVRKISCNYWFEFFAFLYVLF